MALLCGIIRFCHKQVNCLDTQQTHRIKFRKPDENTQNVNWQVQPWSSWWHVPNASILDMTSATSLGFHGFEFNDLLICCPSFLMFLCGFTYSLSNTFEQITLDR